MKTIRSFAIALTLAAVAAFGSVTVFTAGISTTDTIAAPLPWVVDPDVG